jgi:hypothetical protein
MNLGSVVRIGSKERFQTVPYDVCRNKPAPCFDMGKDEGVTL